MNRQSFASPVQRVTRALAATALAAVILAGTGTAALAQDPASSPQVDQSGTGGTDGSMLVVATVPKMPAFDSSNAAAETDLTATANSNDVNTPATKALIFKGVWIVGLLILCFQLLRWDSFARRTTRRFKRYVKQPKLKELRVKSRSLITTLDTSVTKMTESSLFAMAQYGTGVTDTLNEDLAEAKAELSRLIQVQREVDDKATKKSFVRAGLNDIVGSANTVLWGLRKHQRVLSGLSGEEDGISAELERQQGLVVNAENTTTAHREALERASSQYQADALVGIRMSAAVQLHRLESFRTAVRELDASVVRDENAEAVGLSHLSRAAYAGFEAAGSNLDAEWDSLRANDARLKDLRTMVAVAIDRSNELIGAGYRRLEHPAAAAQQALDSAGQGPLNSSTKHADLSSFTAQFFADLEDVEAEVTAINRAHRELPGMMDSARKVILDTEKYAALHRKEVGHSADSLLADARGNLEMAHANDIGRDLRVAHEHAGHALRIARWAQSRAKDEVSEAYRRRSSSSSSSDTGSSGGFGSGGSGGNF